MNIPGDTNLASLQADLIARDAEINAYLEQDYGQHSVAIYPFALLMRPFCC